MCCHLYLCMLRYCGMVGFMEDAAWWRALKSWRPRIVIVIYPDSTISSIGTTTLSLPFHFSATILPSPSRDEAPWEARLPSPYGRSFVPSFPLEISLWSRDVGRGTRYNSRTEVSLLGFRVPLEGVWVSFPCSYLVNIFYLVGLAMAIQWFSYVGKSISCSENVPCELSRTDSGIGGNCYNHWAVYNCNFLTSSFFDRIYARMAPFIDATLKICMEEEFYWKVAFEIDLSLILSDGEKVHQNSHA